MKLRWWKRRIKVKKLEDTDNRVFDNCPRCGWDAPNFDGKTYYKPVGIDIESKIFEDGKVPGNFYPKVGVKQPMMVMGMLAGQKWSEIHICPLCENEFTFINSDA